MNIISGLQFMFEQEFYKPQEKYFGELIRNYQQEDSGKDRVIVVSGFPYDEGAKRNAGRVGSSVAPKIFRQTLNKMQLYAHYSINILDSGDIEQDLQLQQAHSLLQQKHQQIFKKRQGCLLISIGGTNDQSYPNYSSLCSTYPNKKIAVINIDSHFDVRPLKQGKAHSGSPFRLMLEDPRFIQSNSIFFQFGCKGANCSNTHYSYLKERNVEVLWLQKDIRRHDIKMQLSMRSQGGQVFENLINRVEKQAEVIFVSFDLDVVNSKWMPGVSAPSVIGGITNEQAFEIMQVIGRCSKVKLVDFSEFNPAVESLISSHFLVELFYTLSMSFFTPKQILPLTTLKES